MIKTSYSSLFKDVDTAVITQRGNLYLSQHSLDRMSIDPQRLKKLCVRAKLPQKYGIFLPEAPLNVQITPDTFAYPGIYISLPEKLVSALLVLNLLPMGDIRLMHRSHRVLLLRIKRPIWYLKPFSQKTIEQIGLNAFGSYRLLTEYRCVGSGEGHLRQTLPEQLHHHSNVNYVHYGIKNEVSVAITLQY